MNRLGLIGIGLFGASACFIAPNVNAASADTKLKSGCITSLEASDKKAQFEQGIRGQVKFKGEPEQLASVTEKLAEYKIPALSLAVINDGKVAWADTYQSNQSTQKLDCTSLFQAASLSKPVTVLAALRMKAAGKIDFDKDIQSYLTSYTLPQGKQTAENPVTFRNIFSHTSGISPGGYQGYAHNVALPSDVDVLRGSEGVNSPAIEVIATPNENLMYSGGAYTLAELALQDTFNAKFADIMQQWILQPAGMTQADFSQPIPASKASKVAKGHTSTGEVMAGGWNNYPEQAAAGLWTNAIDLAKFLVEIYQGYQGKSTVFSQADIKAMLADERDGLAYGFILNTTGNSVSITHYGGNVGYRTGMTIDLTTGDGLAYLINSDNGGTLGNELLLSAAQVYSWFQFPQTMVTRTAVEPKLLKTLAGQYKWNDQVDLTLTFNDTNKALSLFFPNGDEYQLTPIIGEQLDFIHAASGVAVSFLTEQDNKSFRLYGRTAVKLPKIPEEKASM